MHDTGSLYGEFSDPRLVAIYDTVCPIAEYEQFYLDLAWKLSATTIIDLGCGSGLLTCALASRGHRMIGVEPAPAMLDLARRKPRADLVHWIHGGAASLGEFAADLAIMTGHVAQFFIEDADWHAALVAIHRALRPGGQLAFESRNPLVQPWFDPAIAAHNDWPTPASPRRIDDPTAGPIDWWSELTAVIGDRVRYEIHYRFIKTGDERISQGDLRFRSEAALSGSLAGAGFTVESIFGDWDGRPADASTPEMIFVAARS